MININTNLIEAQRSTAGNGGLFLEDAIVYLSSDDYPGSGSWHNRVGSDITTSGSFIDSGSNGWGFTGNSRLNLGTSVGAGTSGYTYIFEATMGSYGPGGQVLLLTTLDGTIASSCGYNGTGFLYSPNELAMKTQSGASKQQLPANASGSIVQIGLVMQSGVVTPNNPSGQIAYMYVNLEQQYLALPVTGCGLGYGDVPSAPLCFGNFSPQSPLVPLEFYNSYRPFRGALKQFLGYDKALSGDQVRKVFYNLRRGA